MVDAITARLRKLMGRGGKPAKGEARDTGPEYGWGGTSLSAGIVQEEHNAELRGRRGMQAATKMRRVDAQVRAVEKGISLPLRATSWFVEEPKKAGSAEREAANLLRENLMGGMEGSWDDLIREAALGIHYGVRMPEIVWEERAGLVTVARIASRNPELIERWVYDPQGRLAGYVYAGNRPIGEAEAQGGKGQGRGRPRGGVGLEQLGLGQSNRHERVVVPMEKTLHFSYDSENGNPQGFGLWRSMFPHFYIKQALYRIIGIGVERNLLGVPYGKLGGGAGNQRDDKQRLLTILMRLRAAEDGAFVLTEGQEVAWFESQRSLVDAMPFLHHQNVMMAMAGLCSFLTLGQQQFGTQGLASEQVKIFEQAEDANARWIGETITSQLVKRWCLLNYGPTLRCPVVRHRPIRSRDLGAWSAALNSLVSGQLLTPGRDDEEHVRDLMELPEIPAEQRAAGGGSPRRHGDTEKSTEPD